MASIHTDRPRRKVITAARARYLSALDDKEFRRKHEAAKAAYLQSKPVLSGGSLTQGTEMDKDRQKVGGFVRTTPSASLGRTGREVIPTRERWSRPWTKNPLGVRVVDPEPSGIGSDVPVLAAAMEELGWKGERLPNWAPRPHTDSQCVCRQCVSWDNAPAMTAEEEESFNAYMRRVEEHNAANAHKRPEEFTFAK